MKVLGAIAPWFGANREEADAVGTEIGSRSWVGVPFCGGCCELPKIVTRAGVANDVHRHLINMARVIRDPALKAQLVERLEGTLFHADELFEAQKRCQAREKPSSSSWFGATDEPAATPDLEWAFDYFVSCWMGRSATPGTRSEFNGGLSVRWTSSGGDSAVRFRSAIESLDYWHRALLKWNFTALDVFEFLGNVKDQADHALYIDAPWPDDGDGYKHTFTVAQQRSLSGCLHRVKNARVVIRYNDHELIRELYPEDRWTWLRQNTRSQANGEVKEVLILNGPSVRRGA